MVLYRAKRRNKVFKWILAGIVFVTAMCVTFSDLSGAIIPF